MNCARDLLCYADSDDDDDDGDDEIIRCQLQNMDYGLFADWLDIK